MNDKDSWDVANIMTDRFWICFYTVVNILTQPLQSAHPWSDIQSWFISLIYHVRTCYWCSFWFKWQVYALTIRSAVRYDFSYNWKWMFWFVVAIYILSNKLNSACHNLMLDIHGQISTNDTLAFVTCLLF